MGLSTSAELLILIMPKMETFVCVVVIVDIEVACYGYEGVDAVKEALKCGLNMSTEDMPIKVFVVMH